MMNRRNIILLFCIAALLGCFFQYTRLDGFLYVGEIKNFLHVERAKLTPYAEMDAVAPDHFVIIYDPTDVLSMYARHNAETMLKEQKKSFVSYKTYEEAEIPPDTRGVVLATGHLARVDALPNVLDYVRAGGTAVLLAKPESPENEEIPAETLAALGISDIGTQVETPGLKFLTNFVIGGKGETFAKGNVYATTADDLTLLPDAGVEAESLDGVPLLWSHAYGAGKFYGFNGTERDDKTNEGVLSSLLMHCGEEAVYPTVGVALFFLDDFPAPTPEGNFTKIYEETGLSTENFYRQDWWPWMLELARKYGVKYTGLIIETYGDQVKGPFHELAGRKARDNVIIYGRELLKAGGELGLHGYNHQSLAVAGYNQDKLGYVPWASEADMEEATRELYRYVKSLYPAYELHTYVPPSNILSPEGYEAVKKAVPTLKIYASLYDGLPSEHCYYQNFVRNEDGTYEIPRISSGYAPDNLTRWSVYSAINHLGVFSHFVHPDEMFYEESKDKTWAEMKTGMENFLTELSTRFPWLTPVTASESLPYFDDYFDLDYRVRRTTDYLELLTANHSGEVRFLVRSHRVLDHAEGCEAEAVDEDVYFVRMTGERARLYWKENG